MDVFVVFGVSGVGKSTISKLLAEKMGVGYYDADDYHPITNLDKMKKGLPLNDDDRQPWLRKLSVEIGKWSKSKGAVLACSALKESYRKILSNHCDEIKWVFLNGDEQTIYKRLGDRSGHFFDKKLLQSQLETLEVPAYGCHINIYHTPEEIVEIISKHNFNQ